LPPARLTVFNDRGPLSSTSAAAQLATDAEAPITMIYYNAHKELIFT
jgi:hypothetical protein